MLKYINQLIANYYLKKKKKVLYRPLIPAFYDLFKKSGEGLYIVCIKASTKDFLSRIIGYFSKGFSHCVIFLYAEDLKQYFSVKDWKKVTESWNNNYINQALNSDIKTLIISSADSTGMECFDFSKYEFRKISIRKIPIGKEKKILKNLCKVVGRPYDATGLIGWLIKCGDSKYNQYCSESCYDVCIKEGIRIAEKQNPTPGDIEQYEPTQSWKIYSNL